MSEIKFGNTPYEIGFLKDKNLVAVFPLGEYTNHEQRCSIAESNEVHDWDHYVIRSANLTAMSGMNRAGTSWFDFNPETFEINSEWPIPAPPTWMKEI